MIKAIARRLVSLQFAFLSLVAASDAVALDIDFKNGTWSHPNGISANNWDSSQTTGATTLPDGSTATVTATFAGFAQTTEDNLKNIG